MQRLKAEESDVDAQTLVAAKAELETVSGFWLMCIKNCGNSDKR